MELFTMTDRELRRLEAMQRIEGGDLTQPEAALRLALSGRQVKRLWRAYRLGGPRALCSRRRGRPSNNRCDPEVLARAVELVARQYVDFGPTLACEKLAERDGLEVKRETLRKAMIAAGFWTPHRRRRVVHPPRERRPQRGELIQGDGSPHAWFENRGPRCSLLVFIDDATSSIGAARFAPQETTDAYFGLMKLYLQRFGKPLALYVDKHGIFTSNHPRQERGDLTQFARAMAELDIELICANSPQAKGRVERANQTLQDRLLKELRLRNINSIETANRYIDEFLEDYNHRFATVPRCALDAHRPLSTEDDLDRILCRMTVRKVSRNLTVQHGGIIYKLVVPGSERRSKFATVNVRERDDRIAFEIDSREVAFEIFERQRRPVIESKQLNQYLDRSRLGPRISDPAHQRTPAPDHPWRTKSHQSPPLDVRRAI
jgi:hypothetical protein